MDARLFRPMMGVAIGLVLTFVAPLSAQSGRGRQFTAHSQNFIVFASSPEWATQVAEMAELNRRNLALHWLGAELPPWTERVPIHVQAGPNLGAGGETRFALIGGNRIGNWMMSVQGTQERILDSVLPHEITHTIFATHFAPLGKYVPRWADEGACTTVEHISEKQQHQKYLLDFLATGRGLAFNKMFQLKEYPADIMPLYAQGHSAVQFLIDQGGPQKFIKFLEAGMRSEAWGTTLEQFYAYESIGEFQTNWNRWVADGSPQELLAYAPGLQRQRAGDSSVQLASASASDNSIALASNSASATSAPQNLGKQSVPQGAAVPQNASLALGTSVPLGSNGGMPAEPVALDAQTPVGAVSLASRPSAPQAVAVAALGNENWYKRRLREVTGEEPSLSEQSPASPTQQARGVQPASVQLQGPVHQAVGHAPQRQSPGIQVLDWGNSQPVPGIAPNLRYVSPPPGTAPVYR